MLKKLMLSPIVMLFAHASYACTTCNKQVREAIWNSTFVPNLLMMLSAFFVIGIIVITLAVLSSKRHGGHLARYQGKQVLNPTPLATTSTILGIGLGGFIDGIVLHQILQWHEMLSNKMPPVDYVTKSVNMFWDGIFHAFCLVIVMVGIVLLWKLLRRKDIERSGNLFGGGLLLGWSLFNIVEGVIDHHLLKLHNVREITNNIEAWNYGFLGTSIVIMIIGLQLTNGKHREVEASNPRPINTI